MKWLKSATLEAKQPRQRKRQMFQLVSGGPDFSSGLVLKIYSHGSLDQSKHTTARHSWVLGFTVSSPYCLCLLQRLMYTLLLHTAAASDIRR